MKHFQQISKAWRRCNWVNIFNYYQTQDNGIMAHSTYTHHFFPLMHIWFCHHNHFVCWKNWFMQYMVKLDIVSVEIFTSIMCSSSICIPKNTCLQSAVLLKKKLRFRCFPVNFNEFLKNLFYRAPLGDCFLKFYLRFIMTCWWRNARQWQIVIQ